MEEGWEGIEPMIVRDEKWMEVNNSSHESQKLKVRKFDSKTFIKANPPTKGSSLRKWAILNKLECFIDKIMKVYLHGTCSSNVVDLLDGQSLSKKAQMPKECRLLMSEMPENRIMSFAFLLPFHFAASNLQLILTSTNVSTWLIEQ